MHYRYFFPVALSAFSLFGASDPPQVPPSFIAAPVRVDLSALFDAAERATPRVPPGVETWTSLGGPAIGGASYRFNLYRDPLQIGLAGNKVAVHTTVNYWLEVGLRMKGWVKGIGSCGVAPESYRRARLGLQAEVGLNPDWSPNLKITPEDPLRMDSCQVTAVGYDITDKVLSAMKDSLFKAAKGMEQQMRASTLVRQRMESAWQLAQQPLQLAPGVAMTLNPERIKLAPWRSEGKVLILTPEIMIHPALTLGDLQPTAPRPLPPLDLAPAAIQPGFKVAVQTDLSYDQATAQMAKQMVGQKFTTDKGSFEVLSVAIRGNGPNALLELGIKGRVNGKLTLAGQPRFDLQTNTIRLDNLDYTLESKSWITKIGEWLYRSSLRKTLNEKCSLFVDKKFQDLRSMAQQGLNRQLTPELSMAGSIKGFSLADIQVLDDRFRLNAILDGDVSLTWKTPSLAPAPASAAGPH